jgi:hypothetical protein
MKRSITFLLFFVLPVLLPAQEKATAAAQRLVNTKIFAFGGVGFAGTTSDGERDFRIVFAQPHDLALKLFEDLYADGNPEAKSYALSAIHTLAPDRFWDLANSLKGSTIKVVTMSGCIVEEKTLASVAKDIAKGSYDFWLKPH